jgi:hypothetical protein
MIDRAAEHADTADAMDAAAAGPAVATAATAPAVEEEPPATSTDASAQPEVPPVLREDQVQSAVSFLAHPKVRMGLWHS